MVGTGSCGGIHGRDTPTAFSRSLRCFPKFTGRPFASLWDEAILYTNRGSIQWQKPRFGSHH